ncbi:hypothetical protein RI845_14605 [Thalassotalea nanhaiensis]|uniref:Uncharacterized protein n=1 Tax=Thalassotalea nanhaiensis TaxID=3065648 RepID=A0ABY9TIY7_9GAMM|nr:hypothetical protein RI845_14605 [Colwelliaceae bacterium SQ345]
MKNVIKLLAQLGADANLNAHADLDQQARISAMMNELNIDKEQQQAILAGDVSALNKLLDICPDIVCDVNRPDEDDDDEERKISFG